MNFITRILRAIWGIWHILWQLITAVVIGSFHMVLAPIFGEKATKFLIFITYRIGARMILYPSLHRVKNHGKKEIDTSRSYMVVCNHSSNLDYYTSPYSAPVTIRVLVKAELTKIPFFGSGMKAICIPVDRKDKTSKKEGVQKLKKTLDKGYSAFIYPEGTRNKTDEPLLPFKRGAFKMAIDCQVPLLVSTIANARQLNDINKTLDCAPGTLHVYWEKPIETKGMTEKDIPKLMEMTKQLMTQRILQHQQA